MEPNHPNFEEYAQMMQKMMADSMAAVDQARESALAERNAAIAELEAFRAERKSLEEKNYVLVAEQMAKERAAIGEAVSQQLLRAIAARMLQAGAPTAQIATWLEVSPSWLEEIWAHAHQAQIQSQDAYLEYQEMGRGGAIRYHRDGQVWTFPYEFGGGNTLILLFIPTELESGFPPEERREILHFVADRVVREKAAGCRYEIGSNVIEIIKD